VGSPTFQNTLPGLAAYHRFIQNAQAQEVRLSARLQAIMESSMGSVYSDKLLNVLGGPATQTAQLGTFWT